METLLEEFKLSEFFAEWELSGLVTYIYKWCKLLFMNDEQTASFIDYVLNL